MMTCICPKDTKKIPRDKRVVLLLPGAETRIQDTVTYDQSKKHVFHADCPLHGYEDVTEQKELDDDAG